MGTSSSTPLKKSKTWLSLEPHLANRLDIAKNSDLLLTTGEIDGMRHAYPAPTFTLEERLAMTTRSRDCDEARTVHPSLKRAGQLYILECDGPLGSRGDSLLLPDDEVISPDVCNHAAWDFANLEAFAAHIAPEKSYSLIDIGANIGLFSRQLAHRSNQISHFICIEPEPKNFKALKYNLAGLGDRAAFYQLALGSSDGVAEFFRDVENIGNYSLVADAMRNRPHDSIQVITRDARSWLSEHLGRAEQVLWKSDTQGNDELIVARAPLEIWRRVEVALLEMWRIDKPDYDRDAFHERIEIFPNRLLGGRRVSASDVMEYLSGDDWQFENLLLWR